MGGEQINFGFDEVPDFEDCIFLVDDVSISTNKLKILYFISNFSKFVESNDGDINFKKIMIFQKNETSVYSNLDKENEFEDKKMIQK